MTALGDHLTQNMVVLENSQDFREDLRTLLADAWEHGYEAGYHNGSDDGRDVVDPDPLAENPFEEEKD